MHYLSLSCHLSKKLTKQFFMGCYMDPSTFVFS